ncbi:hypothetical protein OHT20_09805 [Streptomyces caniferus]|uniref:Uncharacterized protein n=1 Tax=Streptomyces caniferus TaxID=285557 RepID=A0A640S0X2_9ACTN|nr:hypothetical protein [Streptomyces caniferus]GFE04046.1 hypothetical protein Scani_03140 [Streptomyces caniferus]
MAGHFILRSITTSDLNLARQKGATWSAKAEHADVGWTAASRKVLSDALAGKPIGSRAGLPPHRYLECKFSVGAALEAYLRGAGWADLLVRPDSVGLGLRQLSTAAESAWKRGDKNGALVEQFRHGTATVEVYYVDGLEMYLP